MSRFVVGVTGGIGSGKSTVTDMFAANGVVVVDADIIARQVVKPGTLGLAKIVEKVGPSVLTEQGQLERRKLRQLVFADAELKAWLNSLLHPLIRQQMERDTLQAESDYCLLSVPLLIENELYTQVNRVLIVDVSEEIQLQRSMSRDNNSEQQIRAIMQSQVSREQRLKFADDVIDNNGTKSELATQVSYFHQQYLKLAITA